MKLLKFLINNLLLVIMFCSVVYIYYYWGNLVGKDTPAGMALDRISQEFDGVAEFVDGIRSKQGRAAQQDEQVASAEATKPATGDIPYDESGVAHGFTSRRPDVYHDEPQHDIYVTPEIEESLNRAVEQSAKGEPVITSIPDGKPVEKVAGAPQMQPRQQQVPPSVTRVEPRVSETDPTTALWVNARKAFYKRDYEACIKHYRDLIAATENNHDAYGELGNVYFNQGKKTEAAAAYFEAASILIKSGRGERAYSLVPLLNYLDSEKSRELQQLLESEPT